MFAPARLRHAVVFASVLNPEGRATTLQKRIARLRHMAALSLIPLEEQEMLGLILLIVVILVLIGAFPTWPHSRSWGYGPSGGLGLVVLVIIILLVMGRI